MKYNISKMDFIFRMYDLAYVNKKYIIFTEYSNIKFFKRDLELVPKNITIYCLKKENSIIDFNGFVLVNCVDGIYVISLNTKEIVQIIPNLDNWTLKLFAKSLNDEIFIFNEYDRIMIKFKYNDTCLLPIEEIDIRNYFEENKNNSEKKFDINIIFAFDNIIFLKDRMHVLINN